MSTAEAKHTPTSDQHYEIEIDHAEGTAILSERDAVNATVAIQTMSLTSAANGGIVQLFKSIDVNGDGTLSPEDFSTLADGGDDSEFNAEGWQKLSIHFDMDGDEAISMDEFRFGMKGFGMKVSLESQIKFEAPHYWTLAQWCTEIQAVFNKSVGHQSALLSGWFQQYDGKKSAMRSKSNAAERAQDPTMLVIYQSKESQTQLKKLFDFLDKDKNGTLDASDFAVMSKSPGTSSFWDELKSNFDSDGDESITFDEFVARIIDTVTERISVGSIPRKDWTWRQVIARLTEWANWMVQEQCKEIHDYFLHGEYGSESAEHLEEGTGYGCGMHLGAPAFPGGEPTDTSEASQYGLTSTFGGPEDQAAEARPTAFQASDFGPVSAPGTMAAAAPMAPEAPVAPVDSIAAQAMAAFPGHQGGGHPAVAPQQPAYAPHPHPPYGAHPQPQQFQQHETGSGRAINMYFY